LAFFGFGFVLFDFDLGTMTEDAAVLAAVSEFNWSGIGNSRHQTELHVQHGRRWQSARPARPARRSRRGIRHEGPSRDK
jgi:hypothetical protein